MTENRRKYGAYGEEVAAAFLVKKGYTVIARNFTVRGGELDIVATCGDILCFIEVKTRKNNQYGTPGEAVDNRKKQHLITAAERFLYEYRDDERVKDKTVRFDVIEICTQNKTIRHIKGIDIAYGE